MKHEDVAAQHLAWLTGEEGYLLAYEMPSGMWCAIRPLLFHFTMHIGEIGDRQGYCDRYCYADLPRALLGLEEWKSRGFEGEPSFWRKHPDSDRCRNDNGDPESETIGWPIRG